MNIHISKTLKGTVDGVIGALKQNRRDGGHHIVIVPDNAALYTELKLMDELNIEGAFDIEVASFSRLAKKRLSLKGVLTDDGAMMVLKRVIAENPDALKCFRRLSQSDGFLREIYGLIKDIRNNRIDIEKLKSCADGLAPRLKYKLDDVVYLYDRYIKRLQEKHADGLSYLEKLYLEAEKDGHIATSRIYVMLYDGFSALEYDLIERLAARAVSMDIGVVRNENAPNGGLYEACDVVGGLLGRSGGAGGYKLIEHEPIMKAAFRHIADNIFSYSCREKLPLKDGEIKLIEAKNAREEVDCAAREINALVDGGMSYGDVAVLTADSEKYPPYIKAVFERLGIPYSSGVKTRLYGCAAVKLIRSAFDVNRRNFYIVDALDFLKNPYCAVDKKAVYGLESYCAERGIEYLSRPLDDAEHEAARLALVSSVAEFGGLGAFVGAREFIGIMKRFFEVNGVLEKTREFVLDGGNTTEAADFRSRCLKKIDAILDETARVFDGSGLRLSEFIELFLSKAAATDVAPLQGRLNVYVGGVDDHVFDKKVLFILGANSGAFPKEARFSRIITDGEAALLKNGGVIFDDGGAEAAVHAATVLSSPSERLYITRNLDGGAPSQIFAMLTALFDGLKIEKPRGYEILKEGDELQKAKNFVYLASRRDNLAISLLPLVSDLDATNRGLFDAAYSLVGERERERLSPRISQAVGLRGASAGGKRPISGAEGLFFADSVMRVTQAEKYYACPYAHFLRYGIRLGESAGARLETRDVGNIIHDALDRFIIKAKDMKREAALPLAQKAADEALEKQSVFYKLNSPQGIGVKKRIKNDIVRICADLHEFILQSDFKPEYSEIPISRGGVLEPVRLSGGVYLIGKIDRADVCGDRVSVIDYKTGGATGDVFSDLYYGNSLQLFIYLHALKVNKNYRAAAALYVKLRDSFFKEEDNDARYRAEGCVVDDKKTLFELDNGLKRGAGKSRVLPVKLKEAEGGIVIDPSSDAVGEEDFDRLCALSVKMTEKAVAEIKSGYIAKRPYKNKTKDACKYCAYGVMCRDGVEYRDESAAIPKEELLKIISKE
ncbi:MAG: PD-(D/E)XK nuclease family protein [Clostridiales bacterium]|jgi:ATP-dependent helicase/nuclease subunit B|nr:PD-(D/E)XK nuclease family protein [Clostridiales bacterium]